MKVLLKLLNLIRFIFILIVCIVLLIACISTGIIMADKYKNHEYPFEQTNNIDNSNALSAVSYSTALNTSIQDNNVNSELNDYNNLIISDVIERSDIYIIESGKWSTFLILCDSFTTSINLHLDFFVLGNSNINFEYYDSDGNFIGNYLPTLEKFSNRYKNELNISNEKGIGRILIAFTANIESFIYLGNFGDNDSLGIYNSFIIDNIEKLSNEYDNIYNNGYDEGYDQGLDDTRSNVFKSTVKINAYVNQDNHTLNKPITILPNGLDFSAIAKESEDYCFENSIEEEKFTVEFQFEPFIFNDNMIYISMNYGFYSLIFYDTSGNSYTMVYDTDTKTDNGYAIKEYNSTNVNGKLIEKAIIVFVDRDHTGNLITPDYLSYDDYYDRGYDLGYDNGYKVGINQTLGQLTGWDIIKGAFTSIFNTLQIKVFGLFSLGDIIGLCLILAVVMFFLKFVRG